MEATMRIVFAEKKMSYREIGFFKADKQDGTGFDSDLFHIDTVDHHRGNPNSVTYASRDFAIRAHWLTNWMHKK
jgi:hypothetical protein